MFIRLKALCIPVLTQSAYALTLIRCRKLGTRCYLYFSWYVTQQTRRQTLQDFTLCPWGGGDGQQRIERNRRCGVLGR